MPAASQNTLYMVYFPSYITILLGKDASCMRFAAYHSATPRTVGNNIFYGVMPDCEMGFNALTIASSHEFAEALTDGIPTPGSHPAYPQAWNTIDGYEVADLCEGTRATLAVGVKRYTVQQLFPNSTKAIAAPAHSTARESCQVVDRKFFVSSTASANPTLRISTPAGKAPDSRDGIIGSSSTNTPVSSARRIRRP